MRSTTAGAVKPPARVDASIPVVYGTVVEHGRAVNRTYRRAGERLRYTVIQLEKCIEDLLAIGTEADSRKYQELAALQWAVTVLKDDSKRALRDIARWYPMPNEVDELSTVHNFLTRK